MQKYEPAEKPSPPISSAISSRWDRWTPEQSTLPAEIGLEVVKADLAAVSEACQPIQLEHLAVALDRLLAFAEGFDAKPWSTEDRKTRGREYRKALQILPADLVKAAIDGVCAQHRYGLPKPGDLIAAVKDELAARKALQIKLSAAERRLTPRPHPGFLAATHDQRQAMARRVLTGQPVTGIEQSQLVTHGYLKRDGDRFVAGPKMEE